MKINKPVEARNVPTTVEPSIARGQVSRDEVARRAEEVWRERGQPAGRDEEIWLEAEAELKAKSEMKPVAGTSAQSPNVKTAQPADAQTRSGDASEARMEKRAAAGGARVDPARRTRGA